jgi:hypothetical protein
MDATIIYDEVATLVGVNIPTLGNTQISREFICSVGTSNVPSNASHAPKASNMDGREW